MMTRKSVCIRQVAVPSHHCYGALIVRGAFKIINYLLVIEISRNEYFQKTFILSCRL